jgi:hypothetical protein
MTATKIESATSIRITSCSYRLPPSACEMTCGYAKGVDGINTARGPPPRF